MEISPFRINQEWITYPGDLNEHISLYESLNIKLDKAYSFKKSHNFIGKSNIVQTDLNLIEPVKVRRTGHVVHNLSAGDRFLGESSLALNIPSDRSFIAKFTPCPHYALNGIIIPYMTYNNEYKGNIRVLIQNLLDFTIIEHGAILGELRFYG